MASASSPQASPSPKPKSLSLASTSSSHNVAPASVATSSPEGGSTDFLLSTPPQVLLLLTHAAPLLRGATQTAQVLSWSHSNSWASFAVLLAWCLLCLFGDIIARYALNIVLLGLLGVGYLFASATGRRTRYATQTMDAHKFEAVLDDASHCQKALAHFYVVVLDPVVALLGWHDPLKSRRMVRLLCTSYPAYLAFTYLIGARCLLLVLGSLSFLAPSPYAQVIWVNLNRSLTFRLLSGLTFCVLLDGGQGFTQVWTRAKNARSICFSDLHTTTPTEHIGAHSTSSNASDLLPDDKTSIPPKQQVASAGQADILFTFSIYQNERWWIGLDWTQAMLPSERPAWCDVRGHPLSPPSTFSLPSPTISYIPAPTKSHPRAVLQRCIRWEWIEPDWHVRPDSHSNKSVEAHASDTVDLSKQSTPPMSGPGGVADWARGKMAAATAPTSSGSPNPRRTSWALGSSSSSTSASQEKRGSSPEPPASPRILSPTVEEDDESGLNRLPDGAGLETEVEWIADAQGWAYGDNSWDKMTNRPGMGKFTRRRVWVRRARVVESSKEMDEAPDDRSSTSGLRKRL